MEGKCIILGIYAKFWGFYADIWKIMHTFAADLAKAGRGRCLMLSRWALPDAESVGAA